MCLDGLFFFFFLIVGRFGHFNLTLPNQPALILFGPSMPFSLFSPSSVMNFFNLSHTWQLDLRFYASLLTTTIVKWTKLTAHQPFISSQTLLITLRFSSPPKEISPAQISVSTMRSTMDFTFLICFFSSHDIGVGGGELL